ncbi:MAG: BamA/OMP85 family outer membrane protein, partial [Planctomycetota bacterium]
MRSLEIRGNRSLPADRIARRSGLRAGLPVEGGTLDRAAASVLEEYHREGFLFASVRAVAEPAAANRFDVRLEISEGPRVHIAEVAIEGAKEISAAEARRALGIQPRRLFGLLSPGRYAPEDLEGALARLREHYRSRGFLSALVGFGGLDFDPSLRRARLRILVREGPRYRIAEARVEGSRLLPREDLERAVGGLRGAPYSSRALEEAAEKLRELYLARSDRLPAIAVRTEYREDDSVAAVFEIRAERFVETGFVSISGNRFTRDRVIRARVGLIPGEPFSPREVERTLERIRALGYFTKAEIELEEREEPGEPETTFTDVRVSVAEPERLGSLFELGGGASSGSGAVAYVGVRRANFDLFRLPRSWDDLGGAFRGGGQYIDLTFLPGTKESQYSFRFEEPYLFRSDLSLSVSSGVRAYEREAYDEQRLGGSLQVRKAFDADRRWSAAAAWVVDRVRVDDVEAGAPPDALAAEGRTVLSHPRLELRSDGLERNAV